MQINPLQKMLDFLLELEERRIFHRLSRIRAEALMVEIAVPGERWEVEFFADGHVEVERFRSISAVGENLRGEETLAELFLKHSADSE